MTVQSLPNFIKKRAFLTPDRPAIHFEGLTLTFKQLYERSVDYAGRLTLKGIKKNSCTAVLMKNHLDTVVILFALQLLGTKTIMLNTRLTRAEMTWQLSDSRAEFLLTESSFMVEGEKAEMEFLSLTVLSKEELAESESVNPLLVEEIVLTDICTIMYTSGTTGQPKGVMQTFGNHWWSAMGSALNLGFMESDCWLCTVPLFHISGFSILMRSVIYGMSIVLHENFDENKAIEDIFTKKVTIMSVVSTMLTRITESFGDRIMPVHFRCMLLGGGPAPLTMLEKCIDIGIPVFQSYGMTETASQIVTLSPEDSLVKLGSAGKPLFPAQLKIQSEDGSLAAAGKAGEIAVKGPNITPGYLHRPDATANKLREGWLYTGDIGYVDQDGFLYVLDRRDDLIISGGENIYPAEIEGVLLSHPDVADAGVVGVPDARWGQVPVAFIAAKNGTVLADGMLKEYCQERLAKYKLPSTFIFLDELPRNAAKKLLRRNLRDMWQKDRQET
ncbi:MAG: o-succinylbenzoate--CoA ligase [Bacillota bacterium]|nr:o-succinylbenzoate--CoA ligase [Bacillota bacterium]